VVGAATTGPETGLGPERTGAEVTTGLGAATTGAGAATGLVAHGLKVGATGFSTTTWVGA